VEDVARLEPLPDIDFNIRAGNTLVGFTSLAQVEEVVRGDRLLLLPEDEALLAEIGEEAQHVDRLFGRFRQMQTAHDVREWSEDFVAAKAELRRRLAVLDDRLNRLLALQYGVDPDKKPQAYESWLHSHQPFHWCVEFYGIMARGGFSVVVGNPPYVEYSKVRGDYYLQPGLYSTESCGNLYAFVMERCLCLLRQGGRKGMIVPHSAICTDRMSPIISLLSAGAHATWLSSYDIRPSKLFVGVDQRLAVYLMTKSSGQESQCHYSSKYHRWSEPGRSVLFTLIQYVNTTGIDFPNSIPKISTETERRLWNKLSNQASLNRHLMRPTSSYIVYFHNAPRYWIRAMDFAPYFWNERDGEKLSTQVKPIRLSNSLDASATVSMLNSSLFFWWFIVLSDCRHLNMREIENFPCDLDRMDQETKQVLGDLASALMQDLKLHAYRKEAYYATTGQVVYDEFYPRFSKPIIDEIDRVLARHYGFTDQELDFIINYDIKYRMGDALEAADENG